MYAQAKNDPEKYTGLIAFRHDDQTSMGLDRDPDPLTAEKVNLMHRQSGVKAHSNRSVATVREEETIYSTVQSIYCYKRGTIGPPSQTCY